MSIKKQKLYSVGSPSGLLAIIFHYLLDPCVCKVELLAHFVY